MKAKNPRPVIDWVCKHQKYRKTGTVVNTVITDPIARAVLADMIDTHGGPKAAITHMFRMHHYKKYIDPGSD